MNSMFLVRNKYDDPVIKNVTEVTNYKSECSQLRYGKYSCVWWSETMIGIPQVC